MATTFEDLMGTKTVQNSNKEISFSVTKTTSFPDFEEFKKRRQNLLNGEPSVSSNQVEQTVTTAQKFYDFKAAESKERESELLGKLSYRNDSVQSASNEVKSVSTTESKTEGKAKKKARLNKKGKILIAAYVAIVGIIASLIIANAGKINKGINVKPASNAAAIIQTFDLNF